MAASTLTADDGVKLDLVIEKSQPEAARPLGTCILAHGITGSLEEGGNFLPLAKALKASGFDVLRFSFRGHGHSSGRQEGMTVAGEMLDLHAALRFAQGTLTPPVSLLAASFAAVAACSSLRFIARALHGLVLWYPVLDLRSTFLAPELPWGRRNFSSDKIAELDRAGYVCVEDEFRLGVVLYEELHHYDPYSSLIRERHPPALIVHGDDDTTTSCRTSENAATERRRCDLFVVPGGKHTFPTPDERRHAIDITRRWLVDLHSGRGASDTTE